MNAFLFDDAGGNGEDKQRHRHPGRQPRGHQGKKLDRHLDQDRAIDEPKRERAQKHTPPVGDEGHGLGSLDNAYSCTRGFTASSFKCMGRPMEPPKKKRRIPGETLRKDLRSGLIPQPATLVRAGVRMSIAGGLYLTGHRHSALVMGMMSGMMLLGSVEAHAAKAIAKAVPRARAHLSKRTRKRPSSTHEEH